MPDGEVRDARHACERAVHDGLVREVERRRGLVEDGEARLVDEDAREGEACTAKRGRADGVGATEPVEQLAPVEMPVHVLTADMVAGAAEKHLAAALTDEAVAADARRTAESYNPRSAAPLRCSSLNLRSWACSRPRRQARTSRSSEGQNGKPNSACEGACQGS